MNKQIVSITDAEKILIDYDGDRERVVITDKRLIIENPQLSRIVFLKAIGAFDVVIKGKSLLIRIISTTGANLLKAQKRKNEEKSEWVKILSSSHATDFEKTLSHAIFTL